MDKKTTIDSVEELVQDVRSEINPKKKSPFTSKPIVIVCASALALVLGVALGISIADQSSSDEDTSGKTESATVEEDAEATSAQEDESTLSEPEEEADPLVGTWIALRWCLVDAEDDEYTEICKPVVFMDDCTSKWTSFTGGSTDLYRTWRFKSQQVKDGSIIRAYIFDEPESTTSDGEANESTLLMLVDDDGTPLYASFYANTSQGFVRIDLKKASDRTDFDLGNTTSTETK